MIRTRLLLLQDDLLLHHDAIEDDLDAGALEDGWRAAECWANQLHGVLAAITRLDDGSYGRCIACSKPIGESVLASAPANAYCEDCAPTEVFAVSPSSVSRVDQHAASRG